MPRKKVKNFVATTIFVFIIPFLILCLTIYSIYLKTQIKDLTLSINDLRSEFITDESTNVSMKDKQQIQTTQLDVNLPEANYNIKDVNYYTLLNYSNMIFDSRNNGGIAEYSKDKAIIETVDAQKKNISSYIFDTNLATETAEPTNDSTFVVFRRDYKFGKTQIMYTIQIVQDFINIDEATSTAVTLRKENFPAFLYREYSNNIQNYYYRVSIGLFSDRNTAYSYMMKMDFNKISDVSKIESKSGYIRDLIFSSY